METTLYKLILIEDNGVYAVPDIEITDNFETTFSIQSAVDISQRKDNLSKNISFPGTKNNNRIFNNLYSFNRDSDSSLEEVLYANYSPNIGVRCVLYENSQVSIVGELRINDIARDKSTGAYTYTGVIVGNLVTFFGNIKDIMLTDLPGFDQVLTYNWLNINSTWFRDPAQRFLYPAIDYGKGITPTPTKFDLRNFRPAIYCREYIKAILGSQGYKYKSNFIDSDLFRWAFIPFNEAEFGNVIFGEFATAATATKSQYFDDSGTLTDTFGAVFGAFTTQSYVTINRARAVTSQISGSPDRSVTLDTFTFNRFSQTAVSFSWSIKTETPTGGTDIQLGIVPVYGGTINRDNLIGRIDRPNNPNGGVITLNFDLPYGNYEKNQEYALVAYFTDLNNVTGTQISSLARFGNPDAAVGSLFGLEFGDTFNLKDCVPKGQKAIDLLKSILQLWNMYMIENPENDSELIIEPYDIFYEETIRPNETAVDWTKKIDNSTLHMKINISLPKSYDFKFKDDNDYYNVLYKNTYIKTYGNYSIDNQFGVADSKSIDTTFSPTVIVRESGDDKTMPAIYSGNIQKKASYKSNLRILFDNGNVICNAYDVVITYIDGHTTVSVPAQKRVQQSHHTLSISDQDVYNLLFGLPDAVYYPVTAGIFDLPTLYNEVYENQIAELNDENLFTLETDADLNEVDIQELDLRTPVFISTVQGTSYFKIMNLTYYNRDETSKLILQKIIQ